MRSHPALLAVSLAASTVLAAQDASKPAPEDLSGLWAAKKHFDPEVHGQLLVEEVRGGFRAEIAGRSTSVKRIGNEFAFDLADNKGRFTGRLESSRLIRGHWIRPPTPVSYGPAAFPVVLRPVGQRRWVGTVDPGGEDFSFYMFARRSADGSYDAVLRNPEFDLGNQQGVRKLVREGSAVSLIAARPNSPDRVLSTGRIEPAGFTLTFAGRGGAYEFARDGDSSLVYPRPRSQGPYRYAPPLLLDDGWPTSTVDAENIDRAAMERLIRAIIDMKMDEPDAPEIHALLIARHGRLVLEEYFHGFSRDQLHTLRSAGKSLSGVTIGAAMHAGLPIRLDSPVYRVMNDGSLPEGLQPSKRGMTLENLLTMSSGHYCDDTDPKAPGNEDYINDQLNPPNVIGYFMSVPMVTDPGTNSVYCSMQPHLALSMLGEAAHESPLRIFDRLVARPMQITHYSWPLDTNGRPYGGGSVAVRARDFMKFGQVMLNGGTWRGHRVLDADYVKAATSPQYHLRNVYYGYLWWVEDYPYKERKLRIYSARGAGGQLVFVAPELDLVVTTMGGNYSNRRGMRYLGNLIANSVLPAVREAGDDPRTPVKDLNWNSPYGPSKDGSRVTRP
jgi:CubicO group peptidase (beta-lactamase class C family)